MSRTRKFICDHPAGGEPAARYSFGGLAPDAEAVALWFQRMDGEWCFEKVSDRRQIPEWAVSHVQTEAREIVCTFLGISIDHGAGNASNHTASVARQIEEGYGAGYIAPDYFTNWAKGYFPSKNSKRMRVLIELDGTGLSDHEVAAAVMAVGDSDTGTINVLGHITGRWTTENRQ